ncbi:MAG TPA: thioredoxin family protein [Candidatus Enterenecus merdae]|nr:thioredoxin family protein [Candidatus Enterenecus merdae]
MAILDLNREQFDALTGADQPVLVEFWAPWCTYCRRLGPAYERLAQQRGEELAVARLNIDEQPQIAEREQIEVVPTLVLYQEGRALGSLVAPESKAMIDTFLQETLPE